MRTQLLLLALLYILFKTQAGKINPKRHANPNDWVLIDPSDGSDGGWATELCVLPPCYPVPHVVTSRHAPSMNGDLIPSLLSILKSMNNYENENEYHHALSKKDTKSETKVHNIEGIDEYNHYSNYKKHPRSTVNNQNIALNTEVLQLVIDRILNNINSHNIHRDIRNTQTNELYDNDNIKVSNNESRNKVIKIINDPSDTHKRNRNPNKRQTRNRNVFGPRTVAVDITTEETPVIINTESKKSDLHQNMLESGAGGKQRSSQEDVYVKPKSDETNGGADEYSATSIKSMEDETRPIEYDDILIESHDGRMHSYRSIETPENDLLGENHFNIDEKEHENIDRSIEYQKDELFSENLYSSHDGHKNVASSIESPKDDLFTENHYDANDEEHRNIARSAESSKDALFDEKHYSSDDEGHKNIARSTESQEYDLFGESRYNADGEKHRIIAKSTESQKDDLFGENHNSTDHEGHKYIARSIESETDDLFSENDYSANDEEHKNIARSTESQIDDLFGETYYNADEEHRSIARSIESQKDDLFVKNDYNANNERHRNIARSIESQKDELFDENHYNANDEKHRNIARSTESEKDDASYETNFNMDEQNSTVIPMEFLDLEFQPITPYQSILYNDTSTDSENNEMTDADKSVKINRTHHYIVNEQEKQDIPITMLYETEKDYHEGLKSEGGLNIYEISEEIMHEKNKIPRHIFEENNSITTIKPEENILSTGSSDKVTSHEQNSYSYDINNSMRDVSSAPFTGDQSYENENVSSTQDTGSSSGDKVPLLPVQTPDRQFFLFDETGEDGSLVINDQPYTDNDNDETQIQRTSREILINDKSSKDKDMFGSEINGPYGQDSKGSFSASTSINNRLSAEDQNKGAETEENLSIENESAENKTNFSNDDNLFTSHEILPFTKDTTDDKEQDSNTTKSVRHIKQDFHINIKNSKEVPDYASEFLNFQLNSKFPFNCLSLRLASKNSENNEYILSPWNSGEVKKGHPIRVDCFMPVPYSMMNNIRND